MDLSIIIVNYNGADYIEDCVRSVHASNDTLKKEIILVDNASQDNSVDILKQLESQGLIHLIAHDKNVGFSAGNNLGLNIAAGEYVFLLNNDTVVNETCIQTLYDYFVAHPDVGGVGPQLLNEDGSIQSYGSVFSQWLYHTEKARAVSFLSGAAFFSSYKIMQRIGGLDENFFFYNEDVDLCFQLKKLGYKLMYLPKAKLVHFGGKATATRKSGSIIEGYRGGLYLVKKHYPAFIYSLYKRLIYVDLGPRYIWSVLTKNSEHKQAYKQIFKLLNNKA